MGCPADALRVLHLGETLCAINPKDEWVGCVWVSLRKRHKGTAETESRTDAIAVGWVLVFASKMHIPLFIISAWIFFFFRFSFYGTSGNSGAGIYHLVTEERVAGCRVFPQFSTGIALCRFPSDETSTAMHTCLLGGLSSQQLCWSVTNRWVQEKDAREALHKRWIKGSLLAKICAAWWDEDRAGREERHNPVPYPCHGLSSRTPIQCPRTGIDDSVTSRCFSIWTREREASAVHHPRRFLEAGGDISQSLRCVCHKSSYYLPRPTWLRRYSPCLLSIQLTASAAQNQSCQLTNAI